MKRLFISTLIITILAIIGIQAIGEYTPKLIFDKNLSYTKRDTTIYTTAIFPWKSADSLMCVMEGANNCIIDVRFVPYGPTKTYNPDSFQNYPQAIYKAKDADVAVVWGSKIDSLNNSCGGGKALIKIIHPDSATYITNFKLWLLTK